MGKIVKWLIIAGLAYLAYTEGPGIVERVGQGFGDVGSGLSRQATSLGKGRCLQAAESASERFSEGLRDFSEPPIDLPSWERFNENLRGLIYDAESECSCPRDSCTRAMDAINELNSLIADFDGSLRGSGQPLNPARRQETIDRFLKRARDLERQGN
ncbi:MAG: hypothetical protein AAF560_25365 [Acidobacteriota bacterium]